MFCCYFLFYRLKSIVLEKPMHEYANGGTWAGMLAKLSREQSTVTKSESRKLFSLDGVQVFVNDNDVTLPNGDTVLNGASLLVLSVVRSESTNAGKVDQLLDEQGAYPFKHLIDGGRFVTADARATLEDAGVMLCINDASAKKRGGNTFSFSSMEVSAASSLANEEVDVHDVRVPTNLSKDAPQFNKGKLT
jgi:hypothetical protein